MEKDNNINLKIENKEVAQFTGLAKTQMFFETIMSFLRLVLTILVVGGVLAVVVAIGYSIYADNQPKATKSIATKNSQGKAASKPDAVAAKPLVDLSSWRQLRKDMSPNEVRSLLGEPNRVEGGPFAVWEYPKHGSVTFYKDVVYSWQEPR